MKIKFEQDNKIFKDENFKMGGVVIEQERDINIMFFDLINIKLVINFSKSVIYDDLICENLIFEIGKIKFSMDVFERESLKFYNKLKIVSNVFYRYNIWNCIKNNFEIMFQMLNIIFIKYSFRFGYRESLFVNVYVLWKVYLREI